MPISLGATPEHGFDEPLGLLSDCHRRIENFLSILQKVAERASGRALDEEDRRAVAAALAYFDSAAPRHTADEENSLFPLLRASDHPDVQVALRTLETLEHDHAAATSWHAEVDFWFRRWTELGSLAAPQTAQLLGVLGRLHELYTRHIAVEDREVFPMAKRVLTRAQLIQLGAQMAHRRGLSPVAP